MAADQVKIDLLIDTIKSSSSLREVNLAMRELQKNLVGVEENSAAFRQMNAGLTEGKEKIEDLNVAIQAGKDGGLQGLSTLGSSIAGSFGVATGALGKYCIVSSTQTANNAPITFTDGFEKFARWVKPSNITVARRGQIKLLSSLGNRDRTNIGFTYFEGAQPYGIPHNNPIFYQASQCFGIGDSPVDPNFFKS